MSARTDESDRGAAPDVADAIPADDELITRPTRPRLTAHAPALPTPNDLEVSPPTLPLSKMRILRPKPSTDGAASAAQPADLSSASRLLAAVAAVSPLGPREQTIAVSRRVAATPTAPPTPAPPPRLRVLRGLKIDAEYPIYHGQNLIGRRDDKPVDIDLIDQEPADRVWTSRQHALLTYENGLLTIEDLHSLNGTFVNRHQLFPGRKRKLSANDILQIGTIQLKVTY